MALNKRIRRVFLEHKAQYIGSIVLIILSSYMFSMMNQFASNFGRLVDEFQVNYVQEDATFATASPIGNIQELESKTDALIEEVLSLDFTLANGQTLRLFSQSEKINIPAILEGTNLNDSGDILLGQYFATANGYKIGDTIQIWDQSFTVVGFMSQPNYMYPVQSESDLLPSPNFGTALIHRDDFADVDQSMPFYAVKFNHLEDSAFARAIQFREQLDNQGVTTLRWIDIENNRRVSIVRAEVQILNLVSKAIPGAILLLATVMVANVLLRMIKREASVIGVLYALGYTRQEIYRHYMIFPLFIAVVGGIVGTISGTFLVQFMVSFFVMIFIVPVTGIVLNPLTMLMGLLLPIVFLGVSGYLVVRGELKLSPVELMRGKEDENKVSSLERVVKLERFGFGIRFAIRQQLRSLSRVAFMLVGVAVATILLLWAFFLKNSTDFLITGASDIYTFEYEYNFPELRYDPLPQGAEPFSAEFFLLDVNSSQDFYVTGVAPDSAVINLLDESGAPLQTNQIIFTKPLAEQLGVKQGDTATIIRRLDGHPFSLPVEQVADTYGGNFVFMPLATYNTMFDMPEGSYNGVFSNVSLNIPETETFHVVSLDEKLAGIQELMGISALLIGFIAAIAFVIAVLVIYVVTSLIIDENKDIIALLKVFGYRRKEINILIMNSSTIIVVMGYLIGIPLTIAAVGVLSQTMENMTGIALPPATIHLPYLLIGFVVVICSFELSKWLCRNKITTVSMSDALKTAME